MAKLKSFEFFLNKLLKGFRSVEKRAPNNLEMILIKQEAGNKARDAAKVIEVDFGKPFKQEMEDIKGRMSGIKSLSDELEKMSKGYDEYYGTGTSQKYKEKEILEKINKNNKEAIRAFKSKNPEKELMEDVDFPFDGPDDPKKYYTGGMVDVEPSLSDIGHGSDSLMARTRLISPNNQATTSTGLNYLLAEDNDNIRVPFSKGKAVAKGLDYLMDLFKPKPKVIFDEKRFREGPINLDFLENIDKKDLEPFIRSRDTMGPGGYGMYDDFADMPSGLQAAELISRIKGPRNTINYEAAEMFIGKKLKGNESVDELIEMLIEKKAEGGRIGFA